MIDPTTLWFYRVALGGITLVCVGSFIALVARTVATRGTAAHEHGEAGLLMLWAKNGKTYTVVAGAVGAILYNHFVNGAPMDWPGLFQAAGAGTLRAAIGKNQQAAQQAVVAAKIGAVVRGAADAPLKEGL